MKTKILFLLLFLSFSLSSAYAKSTFKESSIQYYLPENMTYEVEISTPESILGFQVGQFHARHDQVVNYMRHLADQSAKVSIIDIGKTWEQRPQILVVITSENNQLKLDEIIANRTKQPTNNKSVTPLVVWFFAWLAARGRFTCSA